MDIFGHIQYHMTPSEDEVYHTLDTPDSKLQNGNLASVLKIEHMGTSRLKLGL